MIFNDMIADLLTNKKLNQIVVEVENWTFLFFSFY